MNGELLALALVIGAPVFVVTVIAAAVNEVRGSRKGQR